MADVTFETIERQALEQRMQNEKPDNEHRSDGYALVNVLNKEQFDKEHILHSINIPLDEIDEFEKRFDKDKEIIVYCASLDCDASPKAAKALTERGFSRVLDYERGLSDWKHAGDPIESLQAA